MRRRPSRSFASVAWSVFQRLGRSGPAKLRPAIFAGDWSRQAGGRVPKNRSVRLAVPTGSLRLVSSASLGAYARRSASLPCRLELGSALPKQSLPSRHSRRGDSVKRLRATHCICGSPGPFRGTVLGAFSDATAGIAVVSLRSDFPFTLRGLFPRMWVSQIGRAHV